MELKEMSVAEMAAMTASKSPAPGGGSIAAMTGAFGAALSAMVANLTIGKKAYEDVREEMQSLIETAEEIRLELLDAIQKDSESFNDFIAALGMPKETDEEKAARTAAMQRSLKEAAEIPFQTAVTAARVMPLAEKVVQKGNAKAVTDGLVSAMMARTAVRSALVNVRINLESINDTEYVAQMKDKCRDLEGRVVKAEAYILSLVPELSYCKS